jgi:Domain of unknown function (DUF1996).
MFYRAKNGSYKRVPQMVNLSLRTKGGITVYYILSYDGKARVTAFKPMCVSLFWLLALNSRSYAKFVDGASVC